MAKSIAKKIHHLLPATRRRARSEEADLKQFDVPASGLCLVRIGDRPVQRVVVIK